MNFIMHHAPGAGSTTRPVQRATTVPRMPQKVKKKWRNIKQCEHHILGREQQSLMRCIVVWIMPQVQDSLQNLLICSPALSYGCSKCAANKKVIILIFWLRFWSRFINTWLFVWSTALLTVLNSEWCTKRYQNKLRIELTDNTQTCHWISCTTVIHDHYKSLWSASPIIKCRESII